MPQKPDYLLLDKGHVVPIYSLDLDSIKQSSKETCINQKAEDPKHLLKLTAITQKFGFKDYKHFSEEGTKWIEQFKEENGLHKRADLIVPYYSSDDLSMNNEKVPYTLSRRQVSDRLFNSGKPLPKKIFTGYNFNWINPFEYKYNNIDQDYIILTFNLLGDSLIEPLLGDGLTVQIYNLKQDNPTFNLDDYKNTFLHFRNSIESSNQGWVEVFPFNNQLIFLKGMNNEYDFVFPDLREELPPPITYAHSNIKDYPQSHLDENNFVLWDYMRKNSWEDKELYESQKDYYSMGGEYDKLQVHEVKKNYLKKKGFTFYNQRKPVRGTHEDFVKVKISDNKDLHVSNLVTIKDFFDFYENSEYKTRRMAGDSIEPVNQEEQNMPVCVTYLDALAYTAEFEKRHKIPVRLLKIDEYIKIHPGAREPIEDRIAIGGDLNFLSPDGKVLDMRIYDEDFFQSIIMRFNNVSFIDYKGLKFILSDYFGEWLFENNIEHGAAAINTNDLFAIRGRRTPVQRDFFHMTSCGKYKRCKIGFRLCYEA